MGWTVEVSRNGENVVTIDERCLSGKAELSESDLDLIRDCADHLKAFAGPKRVTPCQCPGYERVEGPYPSGFCRDCGCWFPPKSKPAPPASETTPEGAP